VSVGFIKKICYDARSQLLSSNLLLQWQTYYQ